MVTPVQNTPVSGAQSILWETVTTAGSPHTSQLLGGSQPLAGSVHAVGTWGSATVTVQVSNDGTNWATLKDTSASDISFTADGYAEFTTAALYMRVVSSGGTGDDVDVTVVLRG